MAQHRGYVYEWVNKINGKWYIGSHDGSNPNYTASGKLINRAFKKYGMENFTRHVFYCEDFREQEELALLRKDAMNDSNSYNLTNVAKSWDHISWKGIKKSEETRRRMSESAKGRKRPDLSVINISRSIPCVINGVEYPSRKAASISLGCSEDTVQTAIKNGGVWVRRRAKYGTR